MATRTNIKSYTVNLAKSLGYLTFDALVKDTSLHETVSENADVVKDLYQGIKDFAKSPKEALKSNEYMQAYSPILKEGFKNLMDDIKSGTIYNKEREDSVWMSSAMGGDDYDSDFNFDDFGEMSFDEVEESPVDSSTMAAKAQSIATGQNIRAMDIVGKTTAKAINTTTARSAQYIVQAQQASTAMIMKQQAKMFNQVSIGLAGVNQNLGALVSLGEPLTAHMQNSMKFYTETSQKLDKMTELLDNINKSLMPSQQSGSKTSYKGLDSYLTSGGAISLSGMKQMLGRNFKTYMDSSMFGMMLNMQMGSDGKDMFRAMAANPLGTVLSFALPNLLPKSFKDSLDKLGKSLAGFNVALIKKLGSMKGNPVRDFIGAMFGYDDTLKTSMDTSKYNKGKVDFDGKTRKAIIEVIPTYLSKILAALTGGFETRYDYERGRFVNRQQITSAKREIVNDAAKSVGYGFADIEDIQKAFAGSHKNKGINAETARAIQADLEYYLANAIKSNKLLDPNKKNYTEKEAKEMGFKNKGQLMKVKQLYDYYMRTNNWYKIQELNLSINRQRLAISERMGNMSGDDMLVSAFNGSLDDTVFGGARMAVGAGGSYAEMSSYTQALNNRYANKRGKTKLPSRSEVTNKLGKVKSERTRAELSEMYDTLEASGGFATDAQVKKFIELLNKATTEGTKYNETKEKGIAGVKGKIQQLLENPLSLVTDIIGKADKTLFEIIYGKVDSKGEVKEDKSHQSVLGMMFLQMKDMFTTFKGWVKTKIIDPMKNWFESKGGFKGLISSIFGIDIDVALEKVRNKAREIGGNVVQNFKSVGSWSWQRLKGLSDEFGSGSTISAWDYYGGASKRRKRKKGRVRQIAKNVASNAGEMVSDAQEAAHVLITDPDSPVQQTLRETNNAIMKFLHAIVPDDKDLDKTAETTKKVVKTSIKELIGDPSGAITGALLGGGLSILSGGVISPLLAASIGSAAGLVIKSNKVQDMLFGEVDAESGERSGGVLNKKMTDFLTKKLPSVAGFSIAGGLAGLLPIVPGGPIGGMFIGTALGFAKQSDAVQHFLFGNSEEGTSGIFGTEEDKKKKVEWIKKMAPKAAAGALIGAIAGPFGFAGNILVGSALGFASETEVFKRVLFGEEDADGNRKGGITGWIREDIIKPVAEALTPIKAEIRYRSKDFLRMLVGGISKVFKEHLVVPFRDKLNDFVQGPFGKLLMKAASGVGSIVSVPFRAIGAYGNRLRRRQVRQGRADYMSAKERLAYRRANGLGSDAYTAFDTNLAGMEADELETLKKSIVNVRRNKDFKSSSHQALAHQQAIVTAISHTAGSKAGKIAKQALNAGEGIDGVINAVTSAGYDISSIEDQIRANYSDYETANAAMGSVSAETQNIIKDIMKRTGLKSFNDRDAMKALDSVNAELHARNKGGVGAMKQDPVAVQNTLIKEHGENIEAKLVDIYNAIIQGLPIGAKAKGKLYKSGGSDDLAKAREAATEEESFGDGTVHVQNDQAKRETLYSKLFMGTQYRTADPFLGFDEDERSAIEIAFTNFSKGEDTGAVVITPTTLLDDVYTVSLNGKSVTVQLVNGVPQYVSPLKRARMLMAKLAKGTLKGIGKAMGVAGKAVKGLLSGAVKGTKKVLGGIGRGLDWAFAKYNPNQEEDEGSGSGIIPAAMYYRGGGFTDFVKSAWNGAKTKVGSWFSKGSSTGSGLTSGGSDNQSFLEKILTPNEVEGAGLLSGALTKINSSKFNPANFLKSGTTDYNLNTKEGKEAFRREQSTLNIFRETTFMTDKISQKMDVLISGLFGAGALGAAGSGSGGKGGFLGSLLKSTAVSAALWGGIYYLLSGKADSLMSGMYNSVDHNNVGTDSGRVSGITMVDPNTGETVSIATKDGKPVTGVDENGNACYVTTDGKYIPMQNADGTLNTLDEDGTEGASNKLWKKLWKSLLIGRKNPLTYAFQTEMEHGLLSKLLPQKLRTTMSQGLENVTSGAARRNWTSGLNDLPGVSKVSDWFSNTKVGGWISEKLGKNAAELTGKEATEWTYKRFEDIFGKEAGKKWLEYQEDGMEAFLKNNAEAVGKNGDYLFKYAENITEESSTKLTEKIYKQVEKEAAKEDTWWRKLFNKGSKEATENVAEKAGKEATTETSWWRKLLGLGNKEAAEEVAEKAGKEAGGKVVDLATYKAGKEAAEKATKELAQESAEKAAKAGLAQNVEEGINALVKKLAGNSKIAQVMSQEAFEQGGKQLSQEIGERVAKEASENAVTSFGKKAINKIPIFGWILTAVFAAWEFEEGWNSAARTWGVEYPTIFEKFVSGLLPCVLEIVATATNVPVDFIPINWLFGDVLVPICEKLGWLPEDLSKRRNEMVKNIEALNKEREAKGLSAVSKEEYATMSKEQGGLGQTTWGEDIRGFIKADIDRQNEERVVSETKHAEYLYKLYKNEITKDTYKAQKAKEGWMDPGDNGESTYGETSSMNHLLTYAPGWLEKNYPNYKDFYYAYDPKANLANWDPETGAYIGKGSNLLRGKGGFVSQVNPAFSGMNFGGTSFGQNGCAPAVASMLTGMPVGATAGYALGGGYTNATGTSADYFGNLFAQNGIPSEYVFTGAGSAQNYLEQQIASGHPTVLLGQDSSNSSKAYSPFGPGNHYVLATGEDSRGNLIIQDPEANRPNITYNRSILNSVKLGIPTGGSSRIHRVARRITRGVKRALMPRGGASFTITENHKQIWTYLTKNGLSDAGAAGLMGCWQAESSNRPDRIEGDYVKSFPGFEAVASNSAKMDEWTLKLFSMYANKGLKINQGAYQAGDGHYYPGFGLAQWTGPRGYKLLSWCREKDYDWKQLLPQLEYALYELQGSYSAVYNGLKSATDVNEACRLAYNKYEGGKRQDWLQARQNYAITIYNELSGKTYSMPTSTGTASDNIYGTAQTENGPVSGSVMSETGTSSSSSSSSKLGSLGNMFGKMFSAALGGLGKLFGFGDYDDEESSTSGVSGTTGAYNYSGNVINPDGSRSTTLKPLPDLNSSHAINFVNAALSQKGYTETGNNITDFGKFTGADGAPWCASFVSWAMNKAFKGNAENAAKVLYGGPTAAVQTLYNRFSSNNAMSSTPAVGDVVIYKNAGASHTGIVYDVDGNMVGTVEGNTSGDGSFNANGGMVWTKNFDYTKKNTLTGFGRPNWSAVAEDLNQKGFSDSRTSGSAGLVDYGTGLAAARQRAGITTSGTLAATDPRYKASGSGLLRRLFGGDSHIRPLPELNSSDVQNFINAAKSQKGYIEEGDNITDFGKFTGYDGEPWCASFVSWAMNKAFKGNAAKASAALYGGPTPAVRELLARFKANGRLYDTPQVGDIVIYKNGTSHVGIVTAVNGTTITTIEGNTSGDDSFDRNGGMVWEKTFDYTTNPFITGFGRPNWGASSMDLNQKGFADSRTSGSVGSVNKANLTARGFDNSKYAAGGSGLVNYNVAQAGYNTVNRKHRSARSVFGGGSGVVNLSKLSASSRERYISALQHYAGSGSMDNEAMMTLIKGIISLLSNVSANSDQIKEAVVVLNKILEVSGGSSNNNLDLNVSTAASDMEIDDTDKTIREMQQLLQNLAMGA